MKAFFVLTLALLMEGCAILPPVVPLEPIKPRMPADVRAVCDPLPGGLKAGMSMGDLYEYTDALIGLYGDCALRDAAKARWADSQGL